MSQRHHIRTASQGRKPPSLHPAAPGKRPAIRRGLSYNNNNAQSQPQSHLHNHPRQSTTGSGTASRKPTGAEHQRPSRDEEDYFDMSSFPQFCATCEKQIVTPGNSILYCSEACRRNDISNPYLFQAPHSPSLLPSPTPNFEYPPHDIVPQRSPTVLPPLSLAFSNFSISSDVSSEFDEPPSPIERRDSDESDLWTGFHSDSSVTHFSAARKSHAGHSAIAMDGHLPSLVHSPSSSYGTVGSYASYRPLPARHNSTLNTPLSTTKSIDLVLPYATSNTNTSYPASWLKESSLKSGASTSTSFRVAEAGELSYNRHGLDETPRQKHFEYGDIDRSLKRLFSHESTEERLTRR